MTIFECVLYIPYCLYYIILYINYSDGYRLTALRSVTKVKECVYISRYTCPQTQHGYSIYYIGTYI